VFEHLVIGLKWPRCYGNRSPDRPAPAPLRTANHWGDDEAGVIGGSGNGSGRRCVGISGFGICQKGQPLHCEARRLIRSCGASHFASGGSARLLLDGDSVVRHAILDQFLVDALGGGEPAQQRAA